MAIIGNLSIKMSTETDAFTKGLSSAGSAVAGFAGRGLGLLGRGLGSAGSALGGFAGEALSLKGVLGALGGALGVGAIAGGLASLTTAALESVDATGDMAARLGTTAGALTALQHATQLTGSDAADLAPALQKMNANLSDAAAKGGPAADALKRMGLDAKQLITLDPAEAFKRISGGLAKLPNQADRAAASMDIFGKSGQSLLNTLGAGPEKLAELEAEARKLGITFSDIDAAKVGAANDALDRAKGVVGGLGNQLAIQLAPMIEAAAVKFTELATSGDGMGAKVSAAIEWVAKGIGFAGDVLQLFDLGWSALKTGSVEALAQLLDAVSAVGHGVEDLLNLIPGVSVSFGEGASEAAAKLHEFASSSAAEFRDKLAAPPPSEKITRFFDELRASADAAAKAAAGTGEAVRGLGDNSAEVLGDVDKLNKKLQEQVDSFGKSSAEAEINKLKIKGATDSQLTAAHALADRLKGMEKEKKAIDDTAAARKQLVEDLKTNQQKYQEKSDQLDYLRDTGLISDKQHKLGIDKAKKEFNQGPGEYRQNAALELGSKEARSAVLAYQGRAEGAGDGIKDVAKTAREQVVQQVKAVGFLRQLAEAARGDGVKVPGFTT